MAVYQNHHYSIEKGVHNHKTNLEERRTVLWFRPWNRTQKIQFTCQHYYSTLCNPA